MSRYFYTVLSCCLVCLCVFTDGLEAKSTREDSLVLVVPARYRVLQLAADMSRMRGVAVVSYHGAANSEEPLLHFLDGNSWRSLDMTEFASGSFLRSPPRLVCVTGDDNVLPAVLLKKINWGCGVERLRTLLVADMINGLDTIFQFTENEWKVLSARYNLKLKDLSERKRVVNPYSIRRSELPVKIDESELASADVEPAIIFEERDLEDMTIKEISE